MCMCEARRGEAQEDAGGSAVQLRGTTAGSRTCISRDAASGAPPCWAGRLARSVTNRSLYVYVYALPHTTISEQKEQLCADLNSPCVTLIRILF